MAKKKYAGKQWIKKDKVEEYIDAAGLETRRRDYCSLVGVVVQGCLNTLLNECDKTKALEYAKGMINDLLQNRIDISMLVITKALSKKFEEEGEKDDPDAEEKTEEQILQEKAQPRSKYSHNNIPHVRLVMKMRERDLVSAPIAGERVSFVIIKGTKG